MSVFLKSESYGSDYFFLNKSDSFTNQNSSLTRF